MYYASGKEESQQAGEFLEGFPGIRARWLDQRLDQRLVPTFVFTLKAILTLWHTKYALLLSGLGA
ncbi:MAG TPA: hypothetical protein VFA32_19270 [Dehalococcoidia bacterium]|jgi:hypothetical protein|nr:hypothetical protein [Dehalococcoidia bacterium]